MKKIARISAAVMAAAILASTSGVSSFAATGAITAASASAQKEDATMKTRLTTVKERIDIPEDLTKFDYNTYKRNGADYYRFMWQLESDTDWAEMDVEISGKVISSVNVNRSDTWDWTPSFAKLSESKLKAAAKKYINEINPTIADRIEIDEDSLSISLYGNQAYMSFKRVNNGIPVEGQNGTVVINKNTGELISYSLNWVMGATFSESKDAISEKQAQTSFKKEFPVELRYTATYDWEKKEFVPHLIYAQTKFGQIDAFTGKLSTYDDYDTYGTSLDDDDADDFVEEEADEAMVVMDNGASKTVTFSDEELKKLEDESKLIKADTELKNLKKQNIFFIPDGADVTSDYCSYNDRIGAYVRRVSFSANDVSYKDLAGGFDIPVIMNDDVVDDDGGDTVPAIYGNFTFNAETGDIISFYCNSPDIGNGLDQAKAAKTAEKYMKTILAGNRSKFGEITEEDVFTVYEKYDEKGKPVGEGRIQSISYSGNREIDGIISTAENFSLTIGNNEHITSYNISFYDIAYPKAKDTITSAQAYKKFFEQTDYSLKYRCAYRNKDKKVVTALVYSAPRSLYIDAFTGEITDYNGNVYVKNVDNGEYTDLEGSKYKSIAEKLASYGIYLMDEKGRLNENSVITASEFGGLMNMAGLSFSYNDQTKDEKLTRELAAKYLVLGKYNSNIAEIAELKDLFKVSYSDVDEDSDYAGYIAIANATGLFSVKGEKFGPGSGLKRGEALKLIYDYLS